MVMMSECTRYNAQFKSLPRRESHFLIYFYVSWCLLSVKCHIVSSTVLCLFEAVVGRFHTKSDSISAGCFPFASPFWNDWKSRDILKHIETARDSLKQSRDTLKPWSPTCDIDRGRKVGDCAHCTMQDPYLCQRCQRLGCLHPSSHSAWDDMREVNTDLDAASVQLRGLAGTLK